MTELKTLKDLNLGYESYVPEDERIRKDLKAEAINWWKFKCGNGEDICCTCEEMWREFFNITEEDLI